MQSVGDSAALALYAVHYCGNGNISEKIFPAVLTWGINPSSWYNEYPCILFIKHKLHKNGRKYEGEKHTNQAAKSGRRSRSFSSSFLHMKMCSNWATNAYDCLSPGISRDPLFYIWKCAQTESQMLMAAFPLVSAETTACVRGGRACTLQSKHVIFVTAHWHSLQQYDNAAEM